MVPQTGPALRRALAAICLALIALPASFAQTPAEPPSEIADTQRPAPLQTPDQLNNLVAPIALYPDPLLSQVLAASTYPLEIVEAQQWLGKNTDLQGSQLMDAARQQNWDPSVQALVAFPDALRLLANNIRWTTELGNAFLAQQTDVMSAVQRMRARARADGKLDTTPQQVVTTNSQDGESVIEIQPADPQVVYVPIYNPSYVWDSPYWGGYYDLWYPGSYAFGFGYGPGIYMSSYFPSWAGWGGWGWGCGWFGRSLFLNTGFFHRYGFRGGYYGRFSGGHSGRGFGGRAGWAHNPGHRMGVPYSNRTIASRFNSDRFNAGRSGGARLNGGQFAGGARANPGRPGGTQAGRVGASAGSGGMRSASPGEWRRFGDGNRLPSAGRSDARGPARTGDSGFRSGNRGYAGSYRTPAPSSRGYGAAQGFRSAPPADRSFSRGYSGQRGGGSFSAPRQSFSAPRSSAGPGFSRGGSGFSGGRSGGNSGGFSGGRSGSSGGRVGGGGGHRR